MKHKDFFNDMNNYRGIFTISQLILLFERKGFYLTKSMIQKYEKYKIIPPVKGRYYFRQHIFLLVFADCLEKAFDLQEIQVVYENLFEEYLNLEQENLDIIERTFLAFCRFYSDFSEKLKQNESIMADSYLKKLALAVAAKEEVSTYV